MAASGHVRARSPDDDLPRAGLSLDDSTPGDYGLPRPAAGCAQRGADRARRPGLRAARVLRLRHRDPAIDGLAADGLRYNHFHVTSLCSPTRACLHDRPQPPRGRHGLPHRPARWRSPGYTGRVPQSAATLPRRPARRAATTRTAIGKWHLVPSGERSRRGPVRPLAARVRVRALLRVPAGRHQPLGPAPRRATTTTSSSPSRPTRRLPPHRGPRRRAPSGRSPTQHEAAPDQAVLPLLRARRDARAASRHARVGRALPRRVRRRVGAVARRGVRAPGRDRVSSPPAPSSARTPELDRRVERRCRPTRSACSRASRRCSPGSSRTPTRRSGACSRSSNASVCSTTRS